MIILCLSIVSLPGEMPDPKVQISIVLIESIRIMQARYWERMLKRYHSQGF